MDLTTKQDFQDRASQDIKRRDFSKIINDLLQQFGAKAVNSRLAEYDLTDRDTVLDRFQGALDSLGHPDASLSRVIDQVRASPIPYWHIGHREIKATPMDKGDMEAILQEVLNHGYTDEDIERLKTLVACKMDTDNVSGATDLIIDYFNKDDFLGSLEYFDLTTYDSEMSYLMDDVESSVQGWSFPHPRTTDIERSLRSIDEMKASSAPYWTRETDTPRPINKSDLSHIIDSLAGKR